MKLTYCTEHGFTEDYKFCGICGKQTKEYPYCQCSKQLVYPSENFCRECGKKRPDNQDRGK